MLKKLLIAITLFTINIQAQNFQWVKAPTITFTGNSQLISYSVTSDASENVYMVGFKNNSYAYGQIFGTQYYNKYDSTGNLLFSNEITGNVTVYNMTTDGDNNVIMMIGYVQNMTIDTLSLTAVQQGVNYLVVKLNGSGIVLWHKPLATITSVVNNARALDTDAAGNIYVGYDNFGTSYIEKIAPSGTVLFTITQNNVESISSVSVDNVGNIYAAGSCANTGATFANVGAPLPAGITYNSYVVKYTQAGVFQWVKYIEDITCLNPQVKVRTSEAVYFTSQLFGAYEFGPFTAQGPQSFAAPDVFITKLDSAGNFQWIREVPGAGELSRGNRNSLDVDSLGNLYFGGQTTGIINWGNGVQSSTGATFGATDAVLLKYNSDGLIQSAKLAGGANYDRIDCIKISNDNSILITGLVKGNTTFDSFSFTALAAQAYPFVAKLSYLALATNKTELLSGNIYPNPTSSYINFDNISGQMEGTIYNILGQKVQYFNLNTSASLDVSQLSSGTYFIKTEDLKTLKFIKL